MALSGNDRSKQGSDDLHLEELFSSQEGKGMLASCNDELLIDGHNTG